MISENTPTRPEINQKPSPESPNTLALPIVWHKLAFPWSTTTAERAIVGSYELMAFDAPPDGPHPRNIGWALHTGPGFKTHVAGGPAANFEAAKAAAEAEVRRIEAAKAAVQDTLRRKLADHAAHPNDAAIFSAFSQWAQLVREYHATDDEEENERQIEKVDEAALEVMIYEPETKEGMSAQVYVMLHLEHGGNGRNGDFVDISFETECILPDHPHAMATNTLLDRVKRLGRQDKGRGSPRSSLIPSLGLTFVEAATKAKELSDAFKAVSLEAPDCVERRSSIDAEANQIEMTLLSTQPQTPTDAIAVLDILLDPEFGLPTRSMLTGLEVGALAMVRTFLAMLVPGASGDHATEVEESHRTVPLTAESIPPELNDPDAVLVAAYREWREISDVMIRANDDEGFFPDDASYSEAVQRELAAVDILDDVAAVSPAGIIVKLARLFHSTYDQGQINNPDDPAPRNMRSLEASTARLPPVLADAVQLCVEWAGHIMRAGTRDADARTKPGKT